jgi:hypothetical protein
VADNGEADGEECFAAIVAALEAPVGVQPGDRSLHYPAFFAEPRAVAGAALAIRAVIPRSRSALREHGRRRHTRRAAPSGGTCRSAQSGGTRSTSGISSVMSLRLPAVRVVARVSRGRRRSRGAWSPRVGGRPARAGLCASLWLAHASYQRQLATRRAAWRPAAHPRAPGARVPHASFVPVLQSPPGGHPRSGAYRLG